LYSGGALSIHGGMQKKTRSRSLGGMRSSLSPSGDDFFGKAFPVGAQPPGTTPIMTRAGSNSRYRAVRVGNLIMENVVLA
jgi:hypothetical protein